MNLAKKDIANSFSKAASQYDEYAFLQNEVAERLLERLELMNVSPKTILDAGCGTGFCSRALKKRFSKAKITGVDIAQGMIDQAKLSNKLFSKVDYQCADIENLPHKNSSFDLVVSSLTIQWIEKPLAVFKELERVLKPGGLLIFSSLGPDTLTELKQSWAQVDQAVHVNNFIDMHLVGDDVHKAGFENTVMDRDVITMTYETLKGLMKDLKGIGAHNLNANRQRGMLGKNKYLALQKAYDEFRWDDGQLPATYEVVYGHAWKRMEPVEEYHTYKVDVKP